MKIINIMLSVRRTSCNDICLIESGMLPLNDTIEIERNKYMKQKFKHLNPLSPLRKAFELADSVQTTSARMIKTAINDDTISPKTCKEKLADTLKRNVQSSKRMTYTNMNPSYSQHKVYDNENIPEYMRVSFTRFRLSSRELNIEKGRWCRVPREDRKCLCGQNQIQTEEHVLLACPLTTSIRERFDITQSTLEEFFEKNGEITIESAIHGVLQYFEWNILLDINCVHQMKCIIYCNVNVFYNDVNKSTN